MIIINFKDHFNFVRFESNNTNVRIFGLNTLNNVILTGRNYFYPNVLLKTLNDNFLISPYDETVMSLKKSSFYDNNNYDIELNKQEEKIETNIINLPVFFFIYNFDNYYHFLYDVIPYLYFYLYLKKNEPELKLLINFPNPVKKSLYNFNIDILNKFIDVNNDLIIHKHNNQYNKLHISTSLTHGEFSNFPPNKEIYNLFNMMKQNIKISPSFKLPKYIYISRRTWINNDTSNIGTNYTTRRKMMNENELVERLTGIGVVEIFTENLSIDEKIYLFDNAELIIGSIGGGMANLLFSKSTTKTIVIVTPDFLNINSRFKYSMDHTDITYFNDVETYKNNNPIPLFCRVKIINSMFLNKIGEIVDYDNITNKYKVNISNNDIAGFNNELIFSNNWFSSNEFELLDKGLNSPYIVNINNLISIVKCKMVNDELHRIINETKNIEYNIRIEDIFSLVKENPSDQYLKIINDVSIPLNNNIILNTQFICHRINTIEELIKIPRIFGVEIDIRDDFTEQSLMIEHDPFKKGILFENYLNYYKHNTLILNIKSERTELKCIDLMKKYNITNYFFLDSNIPMMYFLNLKYNNKNIACRYSEFEPIEYYDKIKHLISWIWTDCFTQFSLSNEIYSIFKKDNKSICIVSPELQNQKEKIEKYRDIIISNNIIPDSICCKYHNIINWI